MRHKKTEQKKNDIIRRHNKFANSHMDLKIRRSRYTAITVRYGFRERHEVSRDMYGSPIETVRCYCLDIACKACAEHSVSHLHAKCGYPRISVAMEKRQHTRWIRWVRSPLHFIHIRAVSCVWRVLCAIYARCLVDSILVWRFLFSYGTRTACHGYCTAKQQIWIFTMERSFDVDTIATRIHSEHFHKLPSSTRSCSTTHNACVSCERMFKSMCECKMHSRVTYDLFALRAICFVL